MKTYKVYMSMKEKGSTNRIKFKQMVFSERAIGKLMATFVEQTILDPSYRAKMELEEGIDNALDKLEEDKPIEERIANEAI